MFDRAAMAFAGGQACLLAVAMCAAMPGTAHAQAPVDANAAAEGELRIVEVRLRDRTRLALDIFAWQRGEVLYLPADAAFAAMGFAVTVEPSGRASGWFLRENQEFDLDPEVARVKVAGRSYDLGPDDYAVFDGQPHVSLAALDRWFSLRTRFVSDRQVVLFDPPYLLPDEERSRRASTRTGVGRDSSAMDTTGFIDVPAHWRLIGWPHLTANISASHDDSAKSSWAGAAQILAIGDMLFMTGRLAVSASSQGYSTARLTLGRRDASGGLLGPLGATYFEFGDVASDGLSLISRNGAGLGVRVGRAPVTRANDFDATDIVGDATPGWQAELYRDAELLGFQEIGNDGRYVFPQVPLRFGKNRFRIQLFGPSGERETIERTFDIADTLIEPGSLRYSLALFDGGRSLFGKREEAEFMLDGEGDRLQDGLYAEASVGYGLSGGVSLTGFAAMRDRRRGPTRSWYGSQAALRMGRILVSGQAALQDDGALAWNAGVLTGIGPFSIALDREQYDTGFDSEESRFGSDGGIASRTEASVDARLPGWGLALAATEVRQHDGTRDRNAQVRLSTTLLGLSATHRLSWRDVRRPGDMREERIEGGATLSGNLGEIRLRGGLDYDISPHARVRRTRAEIAYRLNNWYLQGSFDREFTQKAGQWRFGINRDWKGVRLGLEGRYDDRKKDTRVMATLSFALDRGPDGRPRFGRAARSDRGQMIVQGFHDADGNGLRDDGERAIDLRFVTDPRGRSPDARGLVEDLPADRVILLAPDLASNPDPFLVPLHPGYRFVARSGATARIDVPLVDSADAEIVLLDASGNPVAGIVAELAPCSGGTPVQTRTAHDGLAYFRQLLPGCYRLSRPSGEESAFELEAKDVTRRTITLPSALAPAKSVVTAQPAS